jgi:hypothetical protein
MKLVMTLLVRDEVDVIEAHLAFHLDAGVDLVIAMDHRSQDGTTEVLRSYEREGYVLVIPQDASRVRQSEWVTAMARLAASDHGADWVINSDADEFWWPCANSIKEALAAIPSTYGVVYAPMCYFLPRPVDGPFSESMTVRLLQPAPINSPPSRYRPSVKAVHRGSREVRVRRGNHEVEGVGARLKTWHPLEVLHYPDRSPNQFASKYANTIESWPTEGRAPGAFVLAAHAAAERSDAHQAFGERAITDDVLGDALAADAVVVDSRLRDALRRLRSSSGEYRRPSREGRRGLPLPTAADRIRHAIDGDALREADHVRLHRDIDDLEVRVRVLERRTGAFWR